MNKPITTLFLLTSVDGKISTGDNDNLDVDNDYPKIPELKAGLQQYYDIEQQTDLFSMNSGRVLAKVGVNNKEGDPEKTPVSFIIIDNKPHLTEQGVSYLSKKSKQLFIATTNKLHPAYKAQEDNVIILDYDKEIDFVDLMTKLKNDYGVDKLTIQTGGTLNSILIRNNLIDKLLLIVAPVLIGGKDTSSLVDGESIRSVEELNKLRSLKLIKSEPLEDSFLKLEYEVLNQR